MELTQAKQIAERYLAEFAPFCHRIEIAGSIRRQKQLVGDIELVCIPKRIITTEHHADLFGGSNIKQTETVHPSFAQIVNRLQKVKGEANGKHTQRILPEGIKLDLFMVTAENWGLQFAIRTGSADYSHFVLGHSWVKNGFGCIDGYLHRYTRGEAIKLETPDEREFFKLIGVKWTEPKDRIYEHP
jgi:DNA polymerase/3'-5' exonuclease PolX